MGSQGPGSHGVSPWDSDRAIVTPFLGAVVPIEGGTRQDEGCEASGQNIEQAVDSSIEGQRQRQQPDHRHCTSQHMFHAHDRLDVMTDWMSKDESRQGDALPML